MRGFGRSLVDAVLVLVCICAPVGVDAQAVPSPQPADTFRAGTDLIVTGSVGSATAGLVSIAIQASGYRGEAGWALRAALSEEFVIFGPTPALRVWDLGMLRIFRSPPDVVGRHFGVGAALTGGMNRGARIGHTGGWFGSDIHEEKPFLGPGLIAIAGVSTAPLPFLSVGVTGSGNLNARRPYAAGVLSLSIGNVR